MKMKPGFMISLDRLPPGEQARIGAVEAGPEDEGRLEAMGLCAGRTVEVVRGGDPMIVRVLGTRIGMARTLAAAVRVERGHEA